MIVEMDLARQVASLGLSARGNAGIKVRQPLAKVLVNVSEGRAHLAETLVDIVKDELNVKDFEFVSDAGRLISYRILPENKTLGPKFGARFPALRKAMEALDPADVARRVAAGEAISFPLDGETIILAPEEVLVQSQPAQGLAVAADKFVTVAVDTAVTPELRAEGLAREVVRRIQAMRKEAGFNIEDRILVYYQAQGELEQVFKTWADYIQSETLANALNSASLPADVYKEDQKVEGEALVLGVKRAG